jgi:hypothetical protein
MPLTVLWRKSLDGKFAGSATRNHEMIAGKRLTYEALIQ